MATKLSFEQLENEPAASFERFVIYRDLGRHRSLRWAYQRYLEQKAAAGSKARKNRNLAGPKNVPGSWVLESKLYQWKTRGAAFDLDCFLKSRQQKGYEFYNILHLKKEKVEGNN